MLAAGRTDRTSRKMETPGLIVQTSREPDNYRLETVDGARVILQAIQAAGMVPVHLQNAFRERSALAVFVSAH